LARAFSRPIFVLSRGPLSVLLFIYFSTLPPPPRSTLFPYTTLFRSHPRAGGRLRGSRWPVSLSLLRFRDRGELYRSAAAEADGRDRKSTRLNSSHVSISYAVFCLKKKISTDTQSKTNKNNITADSRT